MSTIVFSGSSFCKVSPGFSLSNFIQGLHLSSINNSNDIFESYGLGETENELDLDFESYLSQEGDVVSVAMDTAEDNYDSNVYNFIQQELMEVMTSKCLTSTWCNLDSRYGSTFGTEYFDKSGNIIDVEALIETHLGKEE